MQHVIRDKVTKLYRTPEGLWTPDKSKAKTYPSKYTALNLATKFSGWGIEPFRVRKENSRCTF